MKPILARLEKARAYFYGGQLEPSEGILREILAQDSSDLDAQLLLGVVEAKTNRLLEAATRLDWVLQRDPKNYDALSWLGTVKHSQRDFRGAADLLDKAAAIRDDDASALALLGICRLSLGQPKVAAIWFEKVIRLQPTAGQGYFNLGMALRLLNHGEEALEAFLSAVKFAPDRPENFLQAFKQYQQLSRWSEAVRTLEAGCKAHPNSVLLAEALATTYGRLNRQGEAEQIFRRCAAVSPPAAVAYATWLREIGRFQDSVDILENVVAQHQTNGAAYRALAEAKAFESAEGRLIDRLLPIFDRTPVDEKNKMHLAYAIAKAYDFDRNPGAAMHYFDIANALAFRLYPAGSTFDLEETRVDSEIMASIYTSDLIASMCEFGSMSKKPIFIVGMIRSGTTLLDQIVSSHPQVSSAGEQPFWNAEADRIHRKWRISPDPANLAALVDRYLAVLDYVSPGTPRVTDKMPLNFRHLGLICAAFPDAKILHIRRNPLDTCLSIYTTFFAGGPNFAYSQANIVAYYRSYIQFVKHWREALPQDRFYELDYEGLVANPEQTIRSLIQFLDLEWDDACLSHDRNEGSVTTPSSWQARQPIYTSSVERWRRYEPWLRELLQLKDLAFDKKFNPGAGSDHTRL